MPKTKPHKTALEASVDMLARREHATGEVRRKLLDKGYPKTDIEAAVARLLERGALDDGRYAAARARYRAVSSKWGWGKIVQELRAQGIEAGLIAMAKESLALEGVDFAAQAAKAARGGERGKAIARLVRRGYSFAEAKQAVDESEAAE